MMRAWQFISVSGCVALAAIACGGESSTTGLGTGGTSGAGGNAGASSEAGGAVDDASASAGGSTGGAAGAVGSSESGGAELPDASKGTGGAAKDASAAADAPSTIRDAASERAAADGGCTEGTTDRCDTCSDARCCTQIDACEANPACKAAFAKIDGCIGDAGSLNRVRNCYLAFEGANGTGGTARNLAQCIS